MNTKDKIKFDKLWKEMEEIRWQMRAYPQKNDFVRTKKVLRLQDQIIEMNHQDRNRDLFMEHIKSAK